MVTVCEEDPFHPFAASWCRRLPHQAQTWPRWRRLVFAGQRHHSQIAQQLAIKSFQPTSDSPFDALSDGNPDRPDDRRLPEGADHLWSCSCLSPKTVNAYRYRIFEKLRYQQ